MPGHNHYSWCMCGWCHKTRTGGYAAQRISSDFEKSYAKRILRDLDAERGYSACFVNPNASCPKCFARVFYYQNGSGSRVYFDELGWPWPKHRCTDSSATYGSGHHEGQPLPTARKRGVIKEIFEAVAAAELDPAALFLETYGHMPEDLLVVVGIKRRGFENLVKAHSISPPLDHPIHLSFTSQKVVPAIGEYISLHEGRVSVIFHQSLEPMTFKAKTISDRVFEEEKHGG